MSDVDKVCEAVERAVAEMHVGFYEAWYVVAGARIAMETLGVLKLRSCAECSSDFWPGRSDQVYCQAGCAQKHWARTADPWTLEYRRHYKRLDQIVRRRGIDRARLDAWRAEASAMRAAASEQEWRMESFVGGLRSLERTLVDG